jgi:hypothetical protein
MHLGFASKAYKHSITLFSVDRSLECAYAEAWYGYVMLNTSLDFIEAPRLEILESGCICFLPQILEDFKFDNQGELLLFFRKYMNLLFSKLTRF